MRFRNLDLNLLAALDKLIRLRSVSRAAEELSITQSAMSNALNRLRQYFDDPLLVQVGRQMELTPRAEALAGPVRDILVRIEAAVTAPPDFDPATSARQVGLMVSDFTLHTLMPPFVRRVARAAPNVLLDIKPQQSYPGQQLERGEADLLVAPAVFCSPDHPSELLFTDPFVCVVDAHSDAAGRGMLSEAEFLAADFVAMKPPQAGENQAGENYAKRALRTLGIEVRTPVTCFSFAALPDLVQGTDRIALVQARLARRWLKMGGIAILDAPVPIAPMEQCVQWHRMRSHDAALDWLRAQLIAAVDDI
ncbi:LysR family transcriptional regulator [Pararhodobacter zhoushanensis]|uniref:LysR family transcriptional regulator n=1 Tax=Pararhodobacter zhoushanensis TaxID=2479545 RepID=UPI000F8E8D11|nr:LysR family transcriptional regulator [Pararhodobacter zhoushanensis]